MCGYVGFIDHDQIRDPLFAVRNMSQAIHARGPDDFGSWSCDQNKLFLGFKRLAILDLSSLGHQPMVSKSKRFVDGCIPKSSVSGFLWFQGIEASIISDFPS